MAIIAKRTIMSLFSSEDDLYSHQVRIVLAEKGVNVDILPVRSDIPQELLDVNPYGTIPTLIDRELVLYEARIILEYLDERFPHPPLLPVYPVARAESRKMLHRIEHDWYSRISAIKAGDEASRKLLSDSFLSLEPVFAAKPYFLSEEFSLLDCAIVPLLWRFPQLGIEIPNDSKGIVNYMKRLFSRTSIQDSLTDTERHLRVA
jgi:RNA polymerase-associated protein